VATVLWLNHFDHRCRVDKGCKRPQRVSLVSQGETEAEAEGVAVALLAGKVFSGAGTVFSIRTRFSQ
jgi:hypothetical protein